MIKSVCYKCQDREIGCHATCERYITQAEQHQKELDEMRRQREAYNAQMDRMIDGSMRMIKRRHH